MALTKQQALEEALRQQASVGAKGAIDEGYIKSLMTGQDNGFTQSAIDKGIALKPQIPTVKKYENDVQQVGMKADVQPNPYVAPKSNNLSDMISQQSKAQTDSILAQIRQRIAESKANQQGLIAQAGQQYQPLKNQSEVAKSQQLRSVLEQNANMGDRGGIGRQEALTTQTEGENRINQINMQQQNFVDSANAEIARLENEGKYQEAQAVYDQKAKELEALMGESVRQEGLAKDEARFQYGVGQDQQALATNEARYQQEQQQYRDSQSQNKQDQIKNEFINTISRFANDYQAQINRVKNDGDTSNDWQVPYLEQARQGKLGDIVKGQAEQQGALYKMAMDKWESGIPVNSQEANALGVRVGSVKPVKQSGGGGSSSETVKPVSNDFAVDGIEAIMKRYEPAKGIAGALQKAFPSGAMQQEIQNYFQQLADSGYPERELRLLAARYGIQLGSNEVQDSSTRMTN